MSIAAALAMAKTSQIRADQAYALADRGGKTATSASSAASAAAQNSIPKSIILAANDFIVGAGAGNPVRISLADARSLLATAGAWATAYELDFTAQPTQNLLTGGDGVKTIDGKAVWHALNTGVSTTMGITTGVGLVLEGVWGGTYLPPNLAAKFNDLASGVSPLFRSEVEVWARILPSQINIDSEWAELAILDIDNQAETGPNSYHFRTGLRHNTTDHWLSLANYLGVDVGAPTQTTLNLTDNVYVAHLVNGTTCQMFSGFSATPGVWPDISTLTRRGTLRMFTPPNAGGIFPAEPLPLSIGVGFIASNSGVGTNTKMTITNMRVLSR